MLPVEFATQRPREVLAKVPLSAALTVPELRAGVKVAPGEFPAVTTSKPPAPVTETSCSLQSTVKLPPSAERQAVPVPVAVTVAAETVVGVMFSPVPAGGAP